MSTTAISAEFLNRGRAYPTSLNHLPCVLNIHPGEVADDTRYNARTICHPEITLEVANVMGIKRGRREAKRVSSRHQGTLILHIRAIECLA